MKQITVSAAVILRTNPQTHKKEILATQRGYGDFKGGWEFPGGKIESGETPEECIVREIREELATVVKAEKILGVVEYDYPAFHLTMHCILCSVVSGDLKLLEHEDAKWVTLETLYSLNWLPADRLILDRLLSILLSFIIFWECFKSFVLLKFCCHFFYFFFQLFFYAVGA